jgi:WD repeat and SOF domain-containing protein 1
MFSLQVDPSLITSLSRQTIKVLQHAPSKYAPARSGDPTPVRRDLSAKAQPYAKARERQRALNAAKMERMFSKPFVGALDGHVDGVEGIVKRKGCLRVVASGGWAGGPSSFTFS